MNIDKYLLNCGKILHAISFLIFFYLIQKETGSFSWVYTGLGALILFISISFIEDLIKRNNDPLIKPTVFFAKILIPSSLIYLGVFLLLEGVFNNVDKFIILFTSFVLLSIMQLISSWYYECKNQIRIEQHKIRVQQQKIKYISENYEKMEEYEKTQEKVAIRTIENCEESIKKYQEKIRYKGMCTLNRLILLIVSIVVVVSIIGSLTGSIMVFVNMIFFNYIIPILFISIPTKAIINIFNFNELNRRYNDAVKERMF